MDPGISVARSRVRYRQSLRRGRYAVRHWEFCCAGHSAHRSIGNVPPYSQNWDLSIERTIAKDYLLDVRYVGNKGTHLPRFIEGNPSTYGPGVTANNNSQIREYTTCNAAGICNYGSVGLIADDSSSTYNALEVAFSRQYAHGLSFLASYWYSKSLDYISSLNVAGSAPTLVAGENDLAQNPLDLRAEHGPSLFDATQRFVISGTWALPRWQSASRGAASLVNGWQLNTIGSLSTGTPFTVYDSANVSLQGSAPEISGFYSSRPDLISNPNMGQPHTANQWVSRAPFLQLNPVTQAGQFGNEGRNVVRGPGIENVDFSLFKISKSTRLRVCSSGRSASICSTMRTWGCRRMIWSRRRSVQILQAGRLRLRATGREVPVLAQAAEKSAAGLTHILANF